MRGNIGLFKAKTSSQVNGWNTRNKPDGEWVTGFYRDKVGLPVISQFEFNVADYVDYEIDPETLCECSGLKDKNGKLIWENDIVKHCAEDRYVIVEFIDGKFSIEKYGYNLSASNNFEVIGNKFEEVESESNTKSN